MPLSRDRKGGGTKADGSKTREYCSHCYERGRFVMPDLTVRGMQQRVRAKLAKVGVPAATALALTRRVPTLERWKRRSAS